MPKLFNPTDQIIKCQHGGMFTNFKPGEIKDIFDGYAAKHMVNRWSKYGLVELEFGPKEAATFPDYDSFVHSKKIQGITEYLKNLQIQLTNFEIYLDQTGEKKSIEKIEMQHRKKAVESRILFITGVIEELEKTDGRKTVAERKEELDAKIKALIRESKALEKEFIPTALETKAKGVLGNNGDNASKSS